jgi:hypothetical protein
LDPLFSLESLLVALVLGGSTFWLLSAAGVRRSRACAAGAAPAALLLASAVWIPRPPPLSQRDAAHRPAEAASPGYVTSDACLGCHPAQHATWRGSYHRGMTRLATPESVRGDFDGRTLAWKGRRARVQRDGDEFWVDLGADGSPASRRRVVMTTGSHTIQMYWTSLGRARAIERIPFAYHLGERRWLPLEAVFIRPPEHSMELTGWNDNCLACHTTNPRPRAEQPDTEVTEFGIACESCHGPAGEHVAAYRSAPWARYLSHLGNGPDPTILDPRDLDHRRGSQVCGQCHGVRFDGPTEARVFAERGYTYRPGDDLHETALMVRYPLDPGAVRELMRRDPLLGGARLEAVMRQVRENYPRRGLYWPDGRVRVTGTEYTAFLETGCFQRGTLSCTSCHVMHQSRDDERPLGAWAEDQLAVGMRGDAACLQCHAAFGERVREHTHHAEGSEGSRCQNCHMPYTTYGLLKAVRSHTIESPSARETVDAGRPNACNQCHLDRSLGWTARHLEAWFGIPQPELDEEQQRVAASVLWLLRGDAGLRALAAWSLGWEPARQASGTEWMAPLLAQLLDDRYDAVRFVAQRSLRTLPGMRALEYEFTDPPEERRRVLRRAVELWQAGRGSPGGGRGEALLQGEDGAVRWDLVQALAARRDDRPLALFE